MGRGRLVLGAGLPLLLVVVVLGAACREVAICEHTVTAMCDCNDPFFPDEDSCEASVEVFTCGSGDADPDPCVANPCCQIATDAGIDMSVRYDAGVQGLPYDFSIVDYAAGDAE